MTETSGNIDEGKMYGPSILRYNPLIENIFIVGNPADEEEIDKCVERCNAHARVTQVFKKKLSMYLEKGKAYALNKTAIDFDIQQMAIEQLANGLCSGEIKV